jgi:2-keto-3-deoxy-L-fuconate dehydrogenase
LALRAAVREAGPINVRVINLSILAPTTPSIDMDNAEWRGVFAALVDPLPQNVLRPK